MSTLQAESVRDTAGALASLHDGERKILRDVANGAYSVERLREIAAGKAGFNGDTPTGALPEQFASLILCLTEHGLGSDVDTGIACLQPPYSALLSSWISEHGGLAVSIEADVIDLSVAVRRQLAFMWEQQTSAKDLISEVSAAVLESLALNGVGVMGLDGTVRPPTSSAECYGVPALAGLVELARAGKEEGQPAKLIAYDLSKALKMSLSAAEFKAKLGWEILLAIRHVEAHAWTEVPQLTRNGLTAAVVDAAVSSAVAVLTAKKTGCAVMDSEGFLSLRS